MMEKKISLRMTKISKRFTSVQVLKGIDLQANAGEALALIGANGAGKSTMMNILAGIYSHDEGEILIDGERVHFKTPAEAMGSGIAFVQQEMTLMPTMSIVDNMFLVNIDRRHGLIDYRSARRKCAEALARLGCTYPPDTLIQDLGAGDRQLVQISRALLSDPKIIIFDEATSSLTRPEIERLFGVIETLKKQGVAIIYITHMLDEIFSICERVMVIRGGITAGEGTVAEVTHNDLVEMMIGEKSQELEAAREKTALPAEERDTVLSVSGLGDGWFLRDVSFDLHRGEILGVWGLLGSGRTEMARAVTGLDSVAAGTVRMAGPDGALVETRPSRLLGKVCLVTEDRRVDGLALEMSVRDNMTSANLGRLTGRFPGFLDAGRENEVCEQYRRALDIKYASPLQKISTLSGGNQQKVILGRWLQKSPDIYIFDEPTRGLDIGAKADVMKVINRIAAEGAAVLVIMSDIDEIMRISHRYLVMHNGRVVRRLEQDASQNDLMAAAMNI